MQAEEEWKQAKKADERCQQRVQQIQQKHLREVKALEMKMQKNWTKLWRERGLDVEVARKRYINSKVDIDEKYKQEWQQYIKKWAHRTHRTVFRDSYSLPSNSKERTYNS